MFEAARPWFGTITSEPGSGGDVRGQRRRFAADGGYRLTGQKHFGSGSGITSFMLTTALPEGEDEPDWFFLDVRGVPWDGSRGVRLVAEWDGHGMAATQSHGMAYEEFPATRVAWPGNWRAIADAAGPFVGLLFTAVVLGVVETAMSAARNTLAKGRCASPLRAGRVVARSRTPGSSLRRTRGCSERWSLSRRPKRTC